MDDDMMVRIIALACATAANINREASAERLIRQAEKLERYIIEGGLESVT